MVTVLECLPDEILLEVYLRLHPFHLVHAFRHLNARFDTLLGDYNLFQYINIDSDKLAPNYTQSIITYGRRGIVKTLRATVQCRWLDLSHLTSLQKLILLRPSQEQKSQLRTMMTMTEHLRQLEQLTFIKSDDSGYISRSIMTGVFPHLRQCHLYRWYNEQGSAYSLLRCESLRSLTLDIMESLNMALNILISLPYLITFRVHNFHVSETNIPSQIISYRHDHLKHFHISLSAWNGSIHFGYCRNVFDWILPLMPKLATLSIRLTIKRSAMNTDSAIGVLQLLTTIAEHLPIDCCCDCNLLCETGERGKSWGRSYWHTQAKLFISRVTNIQSWLTKKHPTFANLQCRRISKRCVEVYTKTHSISRD